MLKMKDLLAEEKGVVGFSRGQKIKGRITSVKSKMIYIDVGGKMDAMVLGKEFEFVKDYVSDLKVGDEIEVLLLAVLLQNWHRRLRSHIAVIVQPIPQD